MHDPRLHDASVYVGADAALCAQRAAACRLRCAAGWAPQVCSFRHSAWHDACRLQAARAACKTRPPLARGARAQTRSRHAPRVSWAPPARRRPRRSSSWRPSCAAAPGSACGRWRASGELQPGRARLEGSLLPLLCAPQRPGRPPPLTNRAPPSRQAPWSTRRGTRGSGRAATPSERSPAAC